MFNNYYQKNSSTYTLFFDKFPNSKIIKFHPEALRLETDIKAHGEKSRNKDIQ
jgi:hypothetical protein